MGSNKIKCTKCGNEMDVSEMLYKNIERAVAERHQAEIRRALEERDAAVKAAEAQLTRQRAEIERAAKEAARAELLSANKILEEELASKTKALVEMHALKAELGKARRETELAVSKALTDKDAEAAERIRKELATQKTQLEGEMALKRAEDEEKMRGMMAEIEKLRQRAEQGSMQLQGEAQEVTTEEMLRGLFPTDDIKPVPKGQPGADCLQTVVTRLGKDSGKIYYESKRTQGFDKKWIAKLKKDNLEVNADVLVILTKTMPPDKTSYFLEDGVWVCPFSQARDFCTVLREMILKLGEERAMQENKGAKAELLYAYLTSPEFRNHFESILNSFRQMRETHEAEKKKMVKLWSEREKILELMTRSAVHLYGSIKGLGGADIKPIEQLEMDAGKEPREEADEASAQR